MEERDGTKMLTGDGRWRIWVKIYKDKKYAGAYVLSKSYASKRSAKKAASRMVRPVIDVNGHRYARFFAVSNSKTNPFLKGENKND